MAKDMEKSSLTVRFVNMVSILYHVLFINYALVTLFSFFINSDQDCYPR